MLFPCLCVCVCVCVLGFGKEMQSENWVPSLSLFPSLSCIYTPTCAQNMMISNFMLQLCVISMPFTNHTKCKQYKMQLRPQSLIYWLRLQWNRKRSFRKWMTRYDSVWVLPKSSCKSKYEEIWWLWSALTLFF